MKGVHLFLADGFEDMEALATRDVLLRGGIPVVTVSITDEYLVESSHGLQVTADTSWADLEVMEPGTDASDVMIFPGGMPGSKNLGDMVKLKSRQTGLSPWLRSLRILRTQVSSTTSYSEETPKPIKKSLSVRALPFSSSNAEA